MPTPAPPPTAPPLLLSVEEAAVELRIGRSRMYELVRRGEVLSVKVGGSRRVIRDSLSTYINKLVAEQANGTRGAGGDSVPAA
jgi:excisionase family DNA binding protein